ncbi:HesB/YadR/YfhF family protein [Texcoconibacillus texcoconensis]|uniref:Uncharacterized protein YneR n=1 Tax=Texcoconibacillus texcoconensis TaxID=1095777 RepID=A0A840QSM8_9BACI|nr:iron-sulfur cluster biosynthesis family protein [Texcoconibacillus texcoconensis]MBB5174522.1 uncharacterized protein YneR [Texcoconibacillus texcoconensis]
MDLTISERAVGFYKQEMNLEAGDKIRLYVRVGGCGSGGFSVGVMKEELQDGAHIEDIEGIYFFVTQDDAWYFDGMTIDYDPDYEMMVFENPYIDDLSNPQ